MSENEEDPSPQLTTRSGLWKEKSHPETRGLKRPQDRGEYPSRRLTRLTKSRGRVRAEIETPPEEDSRVPSTKEDPGSSRPTSRPGRNRSGDPTSDVKRVREFVCGGDPTELDGRERTAGCSLEDRISSPRDVSSSMRSRDGEAPKVWASRTVPRY